MTRIINIVFILISLFATSYSQSRNNNMDSLIFKDLLSISKPNIEIDTIITANQKLIVSLPKLRFTEIQRYEEGFFKYITCPLDSARITIFCGSMQTLPLTDLTKHIITSKFILNTDVEILRGYRDAIFFGKRERLYFREDNYFKYGITVVYEDVRESNLSFYENIFNNITVIRNKTLNE